MSSFESPHDRAFGVEIECGYPSGWRGAHDLIMNMYGERSEWDVGEDGTDVEIRTPILHGEEGFETLKRTMARIRETGGYVTNSDGMHVHHDAPDYAETPALLVPLVESWRRNINPIRAMVTPRRRDPRYGACPEWSDAMFESLKAWVDGDSQYLNVGRNDLNVASIRRTRPSIEIRLHEGTLDGDVATSWVQFGQRFLYDVVKLNGKRLSRRANHELLLDRIKLSPEATAILLSKSQYQDQRTPLSMWEERRRGYDPDSDYYDEDEDYCDCDMCRGY